MAELYPELVEYLVITRTVVAMNNSISQALIRTLGLSSSAELLLSTSVTRLKALFSMEFYKKF